MKKIFLILTLLAITASVAFADGLNISKPDDFKAIKIGTQRGTIAEGIARKMLGDNAKDQLTTYEKATDVIQALKVGKIQGAIMDEAPATQFVKNDPEVLKILPEALTVEQYAIGFKQGNKELLDQVNKALAEIKADGSLEAIMLKYKEDPTAAKPEDIDLHVGAAGGKLYLGTESGFPPYDIKVGDGYTGIDIEMCALIAGKLNKELAIIAYPFDSLFMAVNSGKVDMICAGITVNEERKMFTDFSEPYEDAKQVAVVLTKDYKAEAAASTVYFTKDISPAGMMAIYSKLGREATGKVAVKLSTGEAGNTHYLSPDLIKELVQKVNGTIVECNTAYGGSRASTALHRQVIEDHGFNKIAKVDIMDEEGEISLPVVGGKHLKEDVVGSHFKNYDFFLVLTHFKGHAMGGFGGALKNISIGIGSSRGKVIIHTAGTKDSGSIWFDDQDAFLESMAEAAKAVSDSLDNGKRIMYISVMNHLSVDCDCDGNPAAPDMHDIGILGSLDPVALDQACVDLVYKAPDGKSLINRMESKHGIHTVEHAEAIGLGSRAYDLVSID